MKKVRRETASVFCEAPPNVWLAEMLENDLRAAGVEVFETLLRPVETPRPSLWC